MLKGALNSQQVKEVNRDIETSEHLHGLTHLTASDEELYKLLAKIE